MQGRNSRTNFLQEEGNDSILGSSNLFKDKNEALESQRGPLTRCQAKELQNKVIRLQVQIKKLLIGMESSRIKDMSCLGIIIILWSKFMSKKRWIRSQETSSEEGPNQATIGPIWHLKMCPNLQPNKSYMKPHFYNIKRTYLLPKKGSIGVIEVGYKLVPSCLQVAFKISKILSMIGLGLSRFYPRLVLTYFHIFWY